MQNAQQNGKQIKSVDGLPVAVGEYEELSGSTVSYSAALELAVQLPIVIKNINTACKASIESGFTSSSLGSEHSYESELEDQINLSGNIQRAKAVPQKCTDSEGVVEYRVHTSTQIHDVGEDFAVHKLTQLIKAKGLKDQANAAAAANDLTALQAIEW